MIKLLDLFSGIGSAPQALKNIGVDFEVVAFSEIDKYAIQSYQLLHGEHKNLGDVSKIDPITIPECNLMVYGFPCQDLSVAGKQLGADEGSETRSSLLWECKKIIEAKHPTYLLMENVKNLVGRTHKANFNKWLEYLEGQGYTNYWKVLNAVDYGTPQNRERVFCLSIADDRIFTFPPAKPRTKVLKDILEFDDGKIPSNMWMNDKPYIPLDEPTNGTSGLIQVGNVDMKANQAIKRVYSIDGVCPTLTTMGGGHRQPKVYIEGKGVRKLTPRECWKVMGWKDEDFDKVEAHLSNTQLYKQAGNSIAVGCLEAIFNSLFIGAIGHHFY